MARRLFVLALSAAAIGLNGGFTDGDASVMADAPPVSSARLSLLAAQDVRPQSWRGERCAAAPAQPAAPVTALAGLSLQLLERVIDSASAADRLPPTTPAALSARAVAEPRACIGDRCQAIAAPSSSDPSPDVPCH